MADEPILEQFDRLGVWSRGDQRAPHKPLLALYALGRWTGGDREKVGDKRVRLASPPLLAESGASRDHEWGNADD